MTGMMGAVRDLIGLCNKKPPGGLGGESFAVRPGNNLDPHELNQAALGEAFLRNGGVTFIDNPSYGKDGIRDIKIDYRVFNSDRSLPTRVDVSLALDALIKWKFGFYLIGARENVLNAGKRLRETRTDRAEGAFLSDGYQRTTSSISFRSKLDLAASPTKPSAIELCNNDWYLETMHKAIIGEMRLYGNRTVLPNPIDVLVAEQAAHLSAKESLLGGNVTYTSDPRTRVFRFVHENGNPAIWVQHPDDGLGFLSKEPALPRGSLVELI